MAQREREIRGRTWRREEALGEVELGIEERDEVTVQSEKVFPEERAAAGALLRSASPTALNKLGLSCESNVFGQLTGDVSVRLRLRGSASVHAWEGAAVRCLSAVNNPNDQFTELKARA